MNRQPTAWISAFLLTIACSVLWSVPAASAAQPSGEGITISQDLTSWPSEMLHTLGQHLSTAWQALIGEDPSATDAPGAADSDDDTEMTDPSEEPPAPEIGPGMVPIG